jgi:hypothetical protein
MEKENKITTKIGSGTPTGELKFEESSSISLYEQAYNELLAMDDGMDRLYQTLSLADFCLQHKLDSQAFYLYEHVFKSFSWECSGEEKLLFDRALQGLSALCGSDDECVWEMSSQIVGDYTMWQLNRKE